MLSLRVGLRIGIGLQKHSLACSVLNYLAGIIVIRATIYYSFHVLNIPVIFRNFKWWCWCGCFGIAPRAKLLNGYFTLNCGKAPLAARDNSEVARSSKQRCYPHNETAVTVGV